MSLPCDSQESTGVRGWSTKSSSCKICSLKFEGDFHPLETNLNNYCFRSLEYTDYHLTCKDHHNLLHIFTSPDLKQESSRCGQRQHGVGFSTSSQSWLRLRVHVKIFLRKPCPSPVSVPLLPSREEGGPMRLSGRTDQNRSWVTGVSWDRVWESQWQSKALHNHTRNATVTVTIAHSLAYTHDTCTVTGTTRSHTWFLVDEPCQGYTQSYQQSHGLPAPKHTHTHSHTTSQSYTRHEDMVIVKPSVTGASHRHTLTSIHIHSLYPSARSKLRGLKPCIRSASTRVQTASPQAAPALAPNKPSWATPIAVSSCSGLGG